MKKPNLAKLQKEVDEFNQKYKVGQLVSLKNDSGEIVQDIIRYPASIMGGHSAMAWLENNGSYMLDRVF